jgi:hypothetical protein
MVELSLPNYFVPNEIIEESAKEEYSSVNLSPVKSLDKPDLKNTDAHTTNFYEDVIKSCSSNPFLEDISEEIKMPDYTMQSVDLH